MTGLSKSRILAHRQCPRRLWLQTYRPELAEEDAGVTTRMSAGTQAGEVARTLVPGGVLVDADDLLQALRDTETLLADPATPIFEATLQADWVLVRIDLLLPDQDGYRLAEVKSSTHVKDYHLSDAAVQSWVAKNAGVAITRTEIAHIDSSFVYPGGGDYRGLFAHADISEQIAPLEAEVPAWIAAACQTLRGNEPEVEPGGRCNTPFSCPFQGYCIPAQEGETGFPPEILPYGKALAAQLRIEGYDDLRNVPEGRLTKLQHRRVWQATRDSRPHLDVEAGEIVRALPLPRFYLDFETIDFAVPIWAGTRPYAQIPFQWSCHVETAEGSITQQAFLSETEGDPRRAFAESLLRVLDTEGPILVYNAGFEGRIIRELAAAFPDLAPHLTAATQRLVDLLPISRKHYYHPDMRGSWSIKAVLPTIAPELAYDGLAVANGGMAQDAFREILKPATPDDRRQTLRQALLDYCERDTLAMVRMAWFFEGRDPPAP